MAVGSGGSLGFRGRKRMEKEEHPRTCIFLFRLFLMCGAGYFGVFPGCAFDFRWF